jgi:CelD/BcsL family acetyltransferase involved in cellulose biosynthesis
MAIEAGNLFATWEWADAWRRHVAAAGAPHVFAVRGSDGSSTAILPLWLAASRRLRMLRFIGHGVSDHLGPICAPGAEAGAVGGLVRALAELAPRWDILLAENLPGPARWEDMLGGRTLRRDVSSSVPIAGQSWAEYLASRSGKLRRLRTYERRLARDHTVRYRLAEQPERLQRDLDLLFSLHAMRWGPQSRALGPARRAFHGDFAARALERGWLRLWFLEVDGSTVAAWYGFRFAGAEWAYQGGRDPAWEAASVGSVLLAHTLREAFQDGLREYKMLRGDEAYKGRFAPDAREVLTIAIGRGVRGRAGVRMAAAAADHRAVARTLRVGLGRARWRALGGAG